MTCLFCAAGRNFDVDAFLRRSKLKPLRIFRKGEPRIARLKRQTKHLRHSGFTVRLDSENSWELRAQVRSARRFLEKNLSELRRLSRTAGVERLCVDLGVEVSSEAYGQFYSLPVSLIRSAAAAGVALEVSVYRCEEWWQEQRADSTESKVRSRPDKRQHARISKRRARRNLQARTTGPSIAGRDSKRI